jgi:hypothetical protein
MTDPVLPQVGLVATPPFLSPLQENAAITRVVVEAIGVLSLETPCTLEKGRLRAGPMGEVVSVELIRELFYYAQRALPPNTRFIVETEKSVKTKTAGAIAEGRGICLSAKEVYTELNDPVAIRWGPLAFELENTLLSQIIHEGPFSRSAMLGDYRDYNSPPPYTKQEKASILEIDFQFLERKDLLFPLDWIGEFFRAFNFPLTLTEILDHSQREKYLLFYVYADYFGFTDLTNTLKTKIESSIYTREVGIIANAQQFRDTLEYLGTYSEPLAYSFFSTLEKGFQDRLFLVDAEDIHTTMRLGYPPRPDTPDSETFYLERGILYRGETPLFDLYTALDRNAQGKENSYFRGNDEFRRCANQRRFNLACFFCRFEIYRRIPDWYRARLLGKKESPFPHNPGLYDLRHVIESRIYLETLTHDSTTRGYTRLRNCYLMLQAYCQNEAEQQNASTWFLKTFLDQAFPATGYDLPHQLLTLEKCINCLNNALPDIKWRQMLPEEYSSKYISFFPKAFHKFPETLRRIKAMLPIFVPTFENAEVREKMATAFAQWIYYEVTTFTELIETTRLTANTFFDRDIDPLSQKLQKLHEEDTDTRLVYRCLNHFIMTRKPQDFQHLPQARTLLMPSFPPDVYIAKMIVIVFRQLATSDATTNFDTTNWETILQIYQWVTLGPKEEILSEVEKELRNNARVYKSHPHGTFFMIAYLFRNSNAEKGKSLVEEFLFLHHAAKYSLLQAIQSPFFRGDTPPSDQQYLEYLCCMYKRIEERSKDKFTEDASKILICVSTATARTVVQSILEAYSNGVKSIASGIIQSIFSRNVGATFVSLKGREKAECLAFFYQMAAMLPNDVIKEAFLEAWKKRSYCDAHELAAYQLMALHIFSFEEVEDRHHLQEIIPQDPSLLVWSLSFVPILRDWLPEEGYSKEKALHTIGRTFKRTYSRSPFMEDNAHYNSSNDYRQMLAMINSIPNEETRYLILEGFGHLRFQQPQYSQID